MVTVAPSITADFNPFEGTTKTHSFGFLRNEADIPGRRRAGSQSWAGVLNTHFWLDPTADLAGLIMTQTLPFVESRPSWLPTRRLKRPHTPTSRTHQVLAGGDEMSRAARFFNLGIYAGRAFR